MMRAAEYVADPYAYYRGLRERGPACWNPDVNAWTLTSYRDIADIVRHPALSSRRIEPGACKGRPGGILEQHLARWLIRMDGPDHARLRALAKRAVRRHMVDAMRLLVRKRAEALLAALLSRAGAIDFIADYAAPLALAAICDLLGLPEQDHELFRQWSTRIERGTGNGRTDAQIAQAIGALEAAKAYLRRCIESAPASGLIAALANASAGGTAMNRDELTSTCCLLLLAGHETSTHSLANALLALFDHPSELQRLRHGDWDFNAVEELLRYDTPLQGLLRRATADFEWRGQRIAAGQTLILWLGAANRDSTVIANPDRLDVGRAAPRHASFGFGVHRCLGAHLAHLIVEEGLSVFLAGAPRATRLATAIEWQGNALFRCQTCLPVRLY